MISVAFAEATAQRGSVHGEVDWGYTNSTPEPLRGQGGAPAASVKPSSVIECPVNSAAAAASSMRGRFARCPCTKRCRSWAPTTPETSVCKTGVPSADLNGASDQPVSATPPLMLAPCSATQDTPLSRFPSTSGAESAYIPGATTFDASAVASARAC